MKFYSRTLGIALTLLTLAGCDASQLTSAGATNSNAADQGFLFGPNGNGTPGSNGGQMGGLMGGMGGLLGLSQFLSALDLTADQQAQIQSISPPQMPQQGDASMAPPEMVNVQALLTADTFDASAVRTAIAAQAQGPQGGNLDRVAMLEATYDVLTADQRQALATALKDAPDAGQPPQGAMPAPDTSALNLTTAQQTLFDAWQAKATANTRPGGQVDFQAMATYFETGDATSLQTDTDASGYPVDELIALASSLSASQRQSLFAQGIPGLPGAGGPGGMPPGQAPQQS